MKRLLLLISAVILMAGITGATTIKSENVTVDLATSEVDADLEIGELTTSKFTYTTSNEVRNVKAQIEGERKNCKVERLQIGSEISCPTDRVNNFTVNMEFVAPDTQEKRNGINVFRYRKSFSSPTERFNMDVVLPQGTGILDQKNVSTPVVLPSDYDIGSTGRRITVSWSLDPELGESIEFQTMYETFSEQGTDYQTILILILSIIGLSAISYVTWRKINLTELEGMYEELSEDEIDLLDLLKENDGSLLQKEAVDKSEYSKAKVSEVVSSLEEKEIIVKEKQGRSNELKISKNYSY